MREEVGVLGGGGFASWTEASLLILGLETGSLRGTSA